MKKTFLITILFLPLVLLGKQPTAAQLKSEIAKKDSIILALSDSLDYLPDSTCVTVLDSTFCLPLEEVDFLSRDIHAYLKEKTKSGLPADLIGWLVLISGSFLGAEGTRRITAAKELYAKLKPILKTRLGLAVLVSAALSATLVGLIGKFAVFNWYLFFIAWPWLALGASFIYERFFNKENAVQAKG